MIKLNIIILIIVSASQIFAQFTGGARQNALSNSDIASYESGFSIFVNPAKASKTNKTEIGIYYSPSPFGFSELKSGAATINYSIDNYVLGNAISYYGFDLFNENKIALSVSKELNENFSLGISTFIYLLKIKNYGNDNSIALNIGGISKLNNDLYLGFYVENINRASYGNYKDQIPSLFSLGISYQKPLFTIAAAIEKEVNKEISPKFGIEYKIFEKFNLRTGFSDSPKNYSGGFGIIYGSININYAAVYNLNLGLSHIIDATFEFE